MSFATVDDLEARLGRPLTESELLRADGILEDVSGSISLYTGQFFTRGTFQLRTRVKRGFVVLPQRPVVSVESVTDRFENAVGWEFDGIDRVYVDCQRAGCAPVQVVDIAYTAGPEDVPQVIVGVTCSIALRALGRAPTDGGVVSESIDSYSYRLASAAGAGSYGLLPDELRVLNRFRRPIGTIRTDG